ncbi:hypothetical protein KP509_27G031500 [Ceratopteris richardii]|uniref:ATP-dependent RNA helicase n=1 Tax=Ceratopteris richardii TaxID=49495 RepID=A0A8T2RF17_CERRI|nr:hypothetical protein KP509_27G031500 [Ceratopteris richardii]
MSLLQLCRNIRAIRRGITSASLLVCRSRIVPRDSSLSPLCTIQTDKIFYTPSKRFFPSIACSLPAQTDFSPNINLPRKVNDSEKRMENVGKMAGNERSFSKRRINRLPVFARQFACALTDSRLDLDSNRSTIFRSVQTAAGHEDEESEDPDGFFLEQDTSKGRSGNSSSLSSKRARTSRKSSDFVEAVQPSDVKHRKRKPSAIAACDESDEDEDLDFLPKKRTKSLKTRQNDDIHVTESRAVSMKKRPIALGDEQEHEDDSTTDSNGISSKHDFDVDEDENKTVQSSFNDKSIDSVTPEESGSGPSHLTDTRFDKFPISPLSIKALHSVLKYERMTTVQEATFPVILRGQDVLAKARTGTGKTIAFCCQP